MRLRQAVLTLTLAVVPVVVAAAPAQAATCPLLTDPAGDAGLLKTPLLYTPNTDIVSADLASGPTTVAVVLRVASFDHNLFTNLGSRWYVGWYIGTNNYAAQVRSTGIVNEDYISSFTLNGAYLGPVPFTFDVANDYISWSIPRSMLPDLATPGATFTTFYAGTFVLSSTSDDAQAFAATYVDQSPGCIPAS